jgi:hypothetical protein
MGHPSTKWINLKYAIRYNRATPVGETYPISPFGFFGENVDCMDVLDILWINPCLVNPAVFRTRVVPYNRNGLLNSRCGGGFLG